MHRWETVVDIHNSKVLKRNDLISTYSILYIILMISYIMYCFSRDGLWRKRIFYTVRYPSGTVWWITRAKVSSDGLFQKYSAAGNNRTNFPKTWVRTIGNAYTEEIRRLKYNDREIMMDVFKHNFEHSSFDPHS